MLDYHGPLISDSVYHVLSRAIGSERLFLTANNYEFFLQKYKQYIPSVADTFAFCLLPNHFHFLIQIKPFEELEQYFKQKKKGKSIDLNQIPDLIMECFSNLLNSYTKSFNKVYQRKGSLFIDYLRRVEIKMDSQFGSTIFYIHKNPVHHGYCDSISSWRWSSYNKIIGKSETILKRTEVLNWFGDVPAFKKYHEQPIYLKKDLTLE